MSASNEFRAVTTGRTLWVDTIFGTLTGTRQYENLSFSTPTAAKNAAQSGDTILMLPGDYTVTAPLSKNEVDWHCFPGVDISYSDGDGDAGSVLGIWDDEGVAMSYKVTGAGVFRRVQGFDADTGGLCRCVHVSHASSDVYIEALTVSVTTTSDNDSALYCILQESGNLEVQIQNLTSSGRFTSCMWWLNGNLTGDFGKIISTGSLGVIAVYAAPVSADFNWEFSADVIQSSGTSCITKDGPETTGLWIIANRIEYTGSSGVAISHVGGKLYVNSQKVLGTVNSSADTLVAELHLNTQKLAASKNGGATTPNLIYVSGALSTAWITVGRYDINSKTGETIKITAGVLNLLGGNFVAGTAKGAEITGGTCRAELDIDTSANNATNPWTKSGGTLSCKNSNIVAEGTRNSIEGTGAQTVEFIGGYLNRPVDADITLTGGAQLTATATLDFGNTVAGASTDLTITVNGAAGGDAVMIGVPVASIVANGVFSAYVSAANTVTVRFTNTNLVAAIDPASGVFRVTVIKA